MPGGEIWFISLFGSTKLCKFWLFLRDVIRWCNLDLQLEWSPAPYASIHKHSAEQRLLIRHWLRAGATAGGLQNFPSQISVSEGLVLGSRPIKWPCGVLVKSKFGCTSQNEFQEDDAEPTAHAQLCL
jgi:hypothetical protein